MSEPTRTGRIMCAHCDRAIRHPVKGSYPPAVLWVHGHSPVGIGNRYCGIGGYVATPATRENQSDV